MKGKQISVRPKQDLRVRLETLAESEERTMTWVVEKCIEGHLPILEERYQANSHIKNLNHIQPRPIIYKRRRKKPNQ